MARNAEKAMTTLARWRQAYMNKAPEKERRPYLASECDDLPSAERWRTDIVREVARKVSQIQNAGLGEFRIRDLNDEINKLLREKGHWEVRIKELGGPDYKRTGPKMLDREGREAPGNRGYRYFGAARDLPGVRELFEQEPPPPPRKTRAELMKDIDADYYGYMDDDDGQLLPLEKAAEKKAVAQSIAQWKAAKEKRAAAVAESGASEVVITEESNTDESTYQTADDDDDDDDNAVSDDDSDPLRIVAHVPVPSQQDIEAALVMRKKQELLARYASSELIQQEQDTKKLAGVDLASDK